MTHSPAADRQAAPSADHDSIHLLASGDFYNRLPRITPSNPIRAYTLAAMAVDAAVVPNSTPKSACSIAGRTINSDDIAEPAR